MNTATLRDLFAKATPGEWRTLWANGRVCLVRDRNSDPVANAYGYVFDYHKRTSADDPALAKANGELIAAMKNNLEALLDVAKAAEQVNGCNEGLAGNPCDDCMLDLRAALAVLS